jgi:hypothetical protein
MTSLVKVTEKQRKQIVEIHREKASLVQAIDFFMVKLIKVKARESEWWNKIAKKNKLPKGVRHMVNHYGQLVPLKRKEDYVRKIF